jgi:hypothetical protein
MLDDYLQLALLQIEKREKIVRSRHLMPLPGAPEYKANLKGGIDTREEGFLMRRQVIL